MESAPVPSVRLVVRSRRDHARPVTVSSATKPLMFADGVRILVDNVVVCDDFCMTSAGERVVFAGDYSPFLRVLVPGAVSPSGDGSALVAAGKFELAGVDVATLAHTGAVGAALLDMPLPAGFTALRYLEWSQRLFGVRAATAKLQAARALQRVGIPSLASRAVEGLTRVERRLFALAHAVVTEPLVVVLEDPLQGLDAPDVERVRQALSAITEGRAALVFLPRIAVAGPTAEFVAAATHLVYFVRGRVVFDGAPKRLVAGGQLFAVTACGGVERFREELQLLGAELHGGSHQFSVSVPLGLSASDLVGAAARTGAGLLCCTPML